MTNASKVMTERHGDVLLITIENPPINAGSHPVRQGVLDAVQWLREDDAIHAAVLIGAGSTFVAGSDLREFGQPLQDPQLPAVIAAIEDCGKPVIAALHGAALGGGFELALGCDARIAHERTVVGLPEVSLGMIPGAGGTQRLPRLVGVARAIELVCSGERVKASRALEWGVIDVMTEGALLPAALEYARSLIGTKRRVRDLHPPSCGAVEVAAAEERALRTGRRRPQVVAAIAAIKESETLDIDAALVGEREVFTRLRQSPDAAALRHVFFAERAAAKFSSAGTVREGSSVQTLAVVGAGTMGSTIAIAALDAGLTVLLTDRSADALAQGSERIRRHYASRIQAGKMSAKAAAQREARITATTDWSKLETAQLVIEAVFEDLTVKQEVFCELDRLMPPGTLLASNTSYLDLDAVAAATGRPQDVLGLHFFTPANVIRLLEVVRGRATSDDSLTRGVRFAQQIGKLPVVANNAFGFIGNRIFAAYRRQCEFMIEEGASPQQVDKALEAFGFAMGPFAVADMSGLDIAWRMRQAQRAAFKPELPEVRYVDIPDRLCELGRLGRKTGAGYYRYERDGGPMVPDEAVGAIIAASRAERGLTARELPDAEILRRALLAMVNEAALLLSEGVAQRASDIDVVLVNGYGFPRWEGGPAYWAAQQGGERLSKELHWLQALSGPGFVLSPPDALLALQSGGTT
ncbi:MAG: 3-hydroxyacyl-CoA dehydrogenase NAD-binding domain-containing protein [Hydrogenophaga sp.]|uniref:3-hydroxyacyl-CoA dehydrogenase NAD-binding domain-containing protein n=1 Tax=Hydrogenophaga sp. TaxID=1904254 RepID=UPI00272631B2|nr:3-hydroxyacyl-CoA dehydrogenase NAD-binding domain-containing protein [Hydrogenophaga sp.]MDO9480652.1 3-hydroxyacyl-CoA dehydrogenase NAD-binding domain-containing protein [Hydrogenophaga sp.]MDP3343181.1 3-hydroxyacyl-CoA dehydrogenase NAD-binding domain-containing protein [Hydrogenophaga sp.]MDP3809241.1 3-hydroxyacyl-CoA dehydrogenase NAD-binding domain-containing protein [Hydrogenophaga sp.]MDP3922545.1 3-hydroxyacyl-CoA dehydrogenase NAD-binding domain-containing protein [Hydrogenophag